MSEGYLSAPFPRQRGGPHGGDDRQLHGPAALPHCEQPPAPPGTHPDGAGHCESAGPHLDRPRNSERLSCVCLSGRRKEWSG